MRYWREELEYNRNILFKMKSFVGGPCELGIWDPLKAMTEHLRKSAWESIVKDFLFELPIEDQRQHRITYRWILDAALTVDVSHANFKRIYVWRDHDLSTDNPQPASVELFFRQTNEEFKQCFNQAIEHIELTLQMLPERE